MAAEDDDNGDDERFDKYVVELRRCFKKQTLHFNEMFEDLKAYVRSEISAALDPKGKRTTASEYCGPSKTPPTKKGKKTKGNFKPVEVERRRSSRVKKMAAEQVPSDQSVGGSSSDEEIEERPSTSQVFCAIF